jgi:hypothetical protein
MSNEFYEASGTPATRSQGASSPIRAEFSDIELGFNKMPLLTGNANKPVVINAGATALTTVAQLPPAQGGTGSGVLTQGSVVFAGPLGVYSQNTTAGQQLFWDNTNIGLGIGTTSLLGSNLRIVAPLTGNASAANVAVVGEVQTDANSAPTSYLSYPTFNATVATYTNYIHFSAAVLNAGGATISNHYGFLAAASIGTTPGTSYGFVGSLASGVGKWNLYMNGSAVNSILGSTRIGSNVAPTKTLDVTGDILASSQITGTTTVGNTAGLRSVGVGTGASTIQIIQPGRPADQKMWEFYAVGADGSFVLRSLNDVYSASAFAFTVTRGSTYTISDITFHPPTTVSNTLAVADTLTITVADGTTAFLARGVTKGVRIVPGATSVAIEGVDNTGVGSYQPLTVTAGTTLTMILSGVGGSYASLTQNTFAVSNILNLGATVLSPTTTGSKIWALGDITITSNRALMGNLHFDGGWKYVATNSSAAAIKLAENGTTSAIQFLFAPNNAGAANAAAVPLQAMLISPAGNISFKDTEAFYFDRVLESVGIGSSAVSNVALRISKPMISHSFGIYNDGVISTTTPVTIIMYQTQVGSLATATNLAALRHYSAAQTTLAGFAAGGMNQYGFIAESSLVTGTNIFGFYGNVPAGTNRFNYYGNTTAMNVFAGNTRIGAITQPTRALDVTGDVLATGSITGTSSGSEGGIRSYGVTTASTMIQMYQPGMGADRKMWEWISDTSGNLFLRTVNDAYTLSQAVFGIARAGSSYLINSVTITAGNPAEVARWDGTGLGLSVNATAKLHLSGTGQAVANFAPLGAQGATAYLVDEGSAVGNGGAIMFADGHGSFAAIKSYVENGTGPTGALIFSLRKLGADVTFTEAFRMYANGGASCAGLLLTAASVAANSGFRIPHGVAPTTPGNGDMWTTTAGVFIRINGVTKTFTTT